MAITLTVGTNTFISLADADTYFNERLNSDVWEVASDEDKKKALIMATKRINRFQFIGQKQSSTQDLEFPRYVESVTYPKVDMNYLHTDFTSVGTPQDVKDATCEEAIALLSFGKSKHINNQKQGIKSISMGNESITYDGTGTDNNLLSQEAYELILKWIQKGYSFGSYR